MTEAKKSLASWLKKLAAKVIGIFSGGGPRPTK